MGTFNLIIGVLCLLMVVINYTIIPKEKRSGIGLSIFNIVIGILNLICAFLLK